MKNLKREFTNDFNGQLCDEIVGHPSIDVIRAKVIDPIWDCLWSQLGTQLFGQLKSNINP